VNVGGAGLGTFVLPRMDAHGDGDDDDDGLLLVVGDQSRPVILGFNVEISLCWSSGYLCANSTECSGPSQADAIYPLGPPAIPTGGGSAFFTAAAEGAGGDWLAGHSGSAIYVVRVDVGGMASRLPATVLGSVPLAPLPSIASAPVLLSSLGDHLLVFRAGGSVIAVSADETGGRGSLRTVWSTSLGSLPPSDALGAGSALSLAVDPRNQDVWAWSNGDANQADGAVGTFMRLRPTDGKIVQRVPLSRLVGGHPLTRPLLIVSPSSWDDPEAEVVLLATYASAAPGCACTVTAIDLSPYNATLRWSWSGPHDGEDREPGIKWPADSPPPLSESQFCADGQLGLVGDGVLIFGRRDGGGVIAIGPRARPAPRP
jgi:hypothetical protein